MSVAMTWREVPAEIRSAIEPHLTKWTGILPGWCAEILVRWNDTRTDSALRTDVRVEYRDAIIEVCPGWLEMPEANRELCVVHELCHVIAGPLVNFARDTIRNVTDEGTALRGVLESECEKAFEGVVEDTARSFIRRREAA